MFLLKVCCRICSEKGRALLRKVSLSRQVFLLLTPFLQNMMRIICPEKLLMHSGKRASGREIITRGIKSDCGDRPFCDDTGILCCSGSINTPLYGAHRDRQAFVIIAAPAAKLQFILLLWAFAVLTIKFVQSDFSLWLVTANSHADKPFIYRLTGVWGNHEGSMLFMDFDARGLWCWYCPIW